MNFYITQSFNQSENFIELYDVEQKEIHKIKLEDISKIINDKSKLIYILACNQYTTYKFDYDSSINKTVNEINFLSDIEDYVVEDISSQKVFFHNNDAYLINKSLIDDLNKTLSLLRAEIFIIPEHLIIKDIDTKLCIDFGDEIFFFNEDLPIRANKALLNSNDGLFGFSDNKRTLSHKEFFNESYYKLVSNNYKLYVNFFEFDVSFSSLKYHSNLSNRFIYTFLGFLIISIFLPFLISYSHNINIKKYNDGISQIFISLDKSSQSISNPKRQIDLIADNFDLSQKSYFKIPELSFIERFGTEYINSIDLDLVQNLAKISIQEIPSSQLDAFMALSSNFNIEIINKDIQSNNNIASGYLIIGLENE